MVMLGHRERSCGTDSPMSESAAAENVGLSSVDMAGPQCRVLLGSGTELLGMTSCLKHAACKITSS